MKKNIGIFLVAWPIVLVVSSILYMIGWEAILCLFGIVIAVASIVFGLQMVYGDIWTGVEDERKDDNVG